MTDPAKAAPMREDVTQAYEDWCRTLPGEFYEPSMHEAFQAGYTARPDAGEDEVERGARALHAVEDCWDDYEWEQVPPNTQALFRKHARAALAAMREGVDRGMVERVTELLEHQMETQESDLPSSIARDRGLTWLEGWFDLPAALSPEQPR